MLLLLVKLRMVPQPRAREQSRSRKACAAPGAIAHPLRAGESFARGAPLAPILLDRAPMANLGEMESGERLVSQALGDDHARLHHLLGEVLLMLSDGERERAESAFEEFRAGLARHIRIEEELLFPCLETRSSWASRPATVMRAEHRRIEGALVSIGTAIAAGPADEARLQLGELQALLSAHDLKEERVLYPASDAALTPSEQAVVAARLRRP